MSVFVTPYKTLYYVLCFLSTFNRNGIIIAISKLDYWENLTWEED